MDIFIAVFTGTVALVLILPAISDLACLLRAWSSRPRPDRAPDEPLQRFLVLVPAHNEEAIIASCVDSLLQAEYSRDHLRVCVVADNCTDSTALAARSAGAECLVRRHATLRGKPRALAWAIEQLPIQEYDAVVVIDADAVVDRLFFAQLNKSGSYRSSTVQTHNAISNPEDNEITWLSSVFARGRYCFAFVLKDRAGLRVPLMGNGMCIGTDVLARLGWNAFSICEDWELYAQYTIQGVPSHVAPKALVYAQEARTLVQSKSQRERWAAGKIRVFLEQAWPLVTSKRVGFHQKLDALGELIAPGPVVHLGIVLLLQLATLAFALPAAGYITAALWIGVGRQVLYGVLGAREAGGLGRFLRASRRIPRYLVWRLGVQFSALRLVHSRSWIKTERN